MNSTSSQSGKVLRWGMSSALCPIFMTILLFVPLDGTYAQQKKKPAAPVPTQAPAEPKKPVYKGKDIPQGYLGELVAKVGAGGVSKGAYDFFLLKLANKNNKTPDSLSPEERKTALDNAIADELVFQAALAAGALKDEYTCWMIIGTYKNQNTTATLDPGSFTEDEMKKFYKEHPEKFPGSVSYDESRGKVKFELLNFKQEEKKKKLSGGLVKVKGMSEDEIMLNTALKEGFHRELQNKMYINNAYLSKKQKKTEDIAPELKKIYKVEVLLKP